MFQSNGYNWPQLNPIMSNPLLPRVASMKEVEDSPFPALNSESVFLNKEDDTILYIKRVDPTGKCTITRYRYYEDPEPTQQQINDSRYVTKEDFDTFKRDILSSIQQQSKGKHYNGPKSNDTN